MSMPFAFAGTLQVPPDNSLPQDPIPFNASGSFDSASEGILNFPSGSATVVVSMGTLPAAGAKGIFIRYDAADNAVGAPPVQIVLNSGSAPIELTLGGFIAITSPSPVAGITAVSVTRTAAAKLRFWFLG